MKALLIFAALLFAAPAQATTLNVLSYLTTYRQWLVCDTAEQMHSILARGGPWPYAAKMMRERMKQINETAHPQQGPACERVAYDPRFKLEPIESHGLVEVFYGRLYDVIIAKVVPRDGKGEVRFMLIDRFVVAGHAI